MPTLAVGSTWTRPADGMVMVSVPAGSFIMGSNGGDLDKTPVHKVNLDAFWIDKTEVTNRMYADCVTAGACQVPSSSQSFTHNNYYDNPQYADYPVIYMGWNSAQSYCKWAGARLPSEAEWEKAARGTDGRIFPWGNDGPDNSLLNYNQNVGDTTAVGSYPSGASPYGALDMAGNVWEWVSDWYDKTYYDQSARSNPEGPSNGTYRVMRGGAWNSDDYYVLASSRGGSNPANAYYEFGIRCSRSSP